jgi:hypothetical protein
MELEPCSWRKTWSAFVACLLGATAAAKFAGLLVGTPAFLLDVDPIIGLTNRQLVLFSAAVESGLVGLLFSPARDNAWVRAMPGLFGAGALLYRLIAQSQGLTRCPCLGGLFSGNRVLTEHEGSFLTAIALFLLISYPLCRWASTTTLFSHAPGD